MSIVSNAQGLLFASIHTEDVQLDGPPVTTLKGWFGTQQIGQAKSTINDAVVSRRGVVTHTVGDAVLCSFASPKSALEAAVDIQNRIAKAANRASAMIVSAKIGLAYGPVRVMAGKVSGDAVNAAGMLMEKCAPGEVLLDKAFAEAIGSGSAIQFEAAGTIDTVTAYRVLGPKDATVTMASPVRAPTPAPDMPVAAPPVAAPPPPAPPAAPPSPRPAPTASAAPAAAAMTLVLKFAGAEHRFRRADGDVNLGRAPDNQIVIPVASVSRKHARIVWHADGAPYLVNLSVNGSSVRFRISGMETPCASEVRLEGTGDIALCASFALAGSPNELVYFRLVSA